METKTELLNQKNALLEQLANVENKLNTALKCEKRKPVFDHLFEVFESQNINYIKNFSIAEDFLSGDGDEHDWLLFFYSPIEKSLIAVYVNEFSNDVFKMEYGIFVLANNVELHVSQYVNGSNLAENLKFYI